MGDDVKQFLCCHRTQLYVISSMPEARIKDHRYNSAFRTWRHRILRIGIGLIRRHGRQLALTAALGFALDFALFQIFYSLGYPPVTAQLISFLGPEATFAWLFGRTLARADEDGVNNSAGLRYLYFITLTVMALCFRTGIVDLRMHFFMWAPRFIIMPGAVWTLIIWSVGSLVVLSPAASTARLDSRRYRLIVPLLAAYLCLIRMIYLPLSGLIPEEVYYWNYSQHLDWSYLDHPPMVAWLNLIGTTILGNTEYGVRIGAFISWIVAAVFAFKLTKEMFSRTAAMWMLLLMSSLPFFFGTAIILTPDAPLTACWAGALLYLYRALVRGRPRAWLGVGICVGLGMLSKYTIALLGPAALLFMLIDPGARKWLKRPQPYLSVIIAIALFSPVIYWNSQHEWVSFLFQSSRRLNETSHFSLHLLLGSTLFLLTPTGLIAAIVAMFRFPKPADAKLQSGDRALSSLRRFALVFTLVPLSVFTLFSLTHEPKLNWTGPSWLAILPAVAYLLSRRPKMGQPGYNLQKFWMPTIAIMTVIYALALNYLSPGLPGVGYPESIKDIAGYRQLGSQIGQVVEQTAKATGQQPLVLGADLYSIASELAFYNNRSGPANTTALHLFGGRALMYKYWLDLDSANGRNIVMVGKNPGQLMQTGMAEHFDSMSTTWQLPATLNGHGIGSFSVRVGYGYRSRP